MMMNFPKAGVKITKIALGGVILIGLGMATVTYAQTKSLRAVERVELDKYLGVWYEIARKPLYFQKECDRNVSAIYTLNENGNVVVNNRCYDKEGKLKQAIGEAFIANAPFNSKLKVSFLPEGIRWLPIGRGDYWILKIDDDYQTVLVGEPRRKYMWILSRTPTLDTKIMNEYLDYAKSVGYDLNDLIKTQQTSHP